jgi:hypothetical protein
MNGCSGSNWLQREAALECELICSQVRLESISSNQNINGL